ncbi:MAG: GntR family transcriptional regulator [Prolixibacteraceae bacterium]|nr:GntR family transcriptional regulator [Prolixibacteraceae bacterium]
MIKRLITIDLKSATPKYRQIIDSLTCAIQKGSLHKGEKIPSVNQICAEQNVSRDTVMQAFKELKAKGIIISQPGKGYYIISDEINNDHKVFLLFDEMDSSKEALYYSLINSMKGRAVIDVYFHHFNYKLFKSQILKSIGNYTSYIIMPANFNNTINILSKLPKGNVFIMGRLKSDLNDFSAVYQDFEQDLYDALKEGAGLLKKYRKLVFVQTEGKAPAERIKGFQRFCKEYDFSYQVINNFNGARPGLYEAWFFTEDKDIVQMIKIAGDYQYKIGKKFGIVSFNDSVLNEVVAGGLTTISSNYAEMGLSLGNMVLSGKNGKIRNPSKLIIRNSL